MLLRCFEMRQLQELPKTLNNSSKSTTVVEPSPLMSVLHPRCNQIPQGCPTSRLL